MCLVVLNGSLIGWRWQNVHVRMVFLKVPTHLSPKLPNSFFHQCLSGYFLHVEIYSINILRTALPPLVLSYAKIGKKVQFLVAFFSSQFLFFWNSSIKISLDSFMFSVGVSKNILVFLFGFGALTNQWCQKMQEAMKEMIFVENIWKVDSKHSPRV